MDKLTLINKSREIFGDNKYDYSLVAENFSSKEKIKIICPIHGVFEKTYEKHINSKQGCPKCIGRFRYDTQSFIEHCLTQKNIDKLSFENVKYINNKTKVKMYCHELDENGNEHGEFEISPGHFLSGERCPKCRYIKSAAGRRRDLAEVIRLANEVHKNKYDYSLITEYKNDRIKYPIICLEHGVFEQTMNNHIKGKQGCPKCGRINTINSRIYNNKDFIKKANLIHNDKYDYSLVEYNKCNEKVEIICPEHGAFWQTPANHLFGQGCPKCSQSKLENILMIFLNENNIKFETQKTFEWLKYKNNLYLDFYLPEYNIAIECQGIQHFEPIGFGEKNEDIIQNMFKMIQDRDKIKRKLCKENNLKMFYFNYNDPIDKLNFLKEYVTNSK